MQKLILPLREMFLTAGFQNTAYRNRFGFSHFGQDSISIAGDRSVLASGDGRVLAAGLDSLLGNTLIILYPRSYGASEEDLVIRYCHLDTLAVQENDRVSTGMLIGRYGNTGRYSTGAHLHVEVDLDTKYFAYSATVAQSGTIVKAGNSTTMVNPAKALWIAPGQWQGASRVTFGGLPYVTASDRSKRV